MASIQGFYNGSITSLDDRLLRAGAAFIVAAFALFGLYLQADGDRSVLLLAWFVCAFAVGLSLLVFGFVARRREKKCVGLWRLMQTHPDVELSLYLQQSGNTLSDVQKATRTINDSGAGLVVVDTVNDRLYDNRLNSNENITFKCHNCGASSTSSVGLFEGMSVVCQYCEAPAENGQIPQSSNRHESLIKSNTERMSLLLQSGQHQGKINLPLLIFLLFIFWPAAIVYIIKVNGKN